MNEQTREQAAAAALGALSPDELARLEDEAAESPALAAQLDEYRDTVATLEASVPRERPSPDLFDRVLTQIEAEQPASKLAEESSLRSGAAPAGTRRLWPAFGAGLAAATAAIALVLTLAGGDDLGTPQARAAVSGTEEFPAVHGEARLYAPDEEDGRLVLDLAEVPSLEPGAHYEVWVLRRTADGEMESVGVFSTTAADVDLELRLPGPGEYEAVDVSVEPDGGPAEHSGRSLAGGRFERDA